MPTPRKTRRPLMLGVMAGVGAAAALWPRGPRLEWYTSPLVSFAGAERQVRFLMPVGWHSIYGTFSPYEHEAMILFGPEEEGSWLPTVLRSWLFGPPDRGASIVVSFGPPDMPPYQTEEPFGAPTGQWGASKSIKRGIWYTLTYYREDRTKFESTYRQICESFRVIQ